MKIGIIGDTHANTNETIDTIDRILAHSPDVKELYQLGDFGFNFPGTLMYPVDVSTHLVLNTDGVTLGFIAGNHENYRSLYEITGYSRREPDGKAYDLFPALRWLSPGHVIGHGGLCIGGAVSVDKEYRERNVSWWAEEELTDEQVTFCSEVKGADFVLTHDIPTCSKFSFTKHDTGFWPEDIVKEAIDHSQKIDSILTAVRPGIVFHGHLHESYVQETDDYSLVGIADCSRRHSAVVFDVNSHTIDFV